MFSKSHQLRIIFTLQFASQEKTNVDFPMLFVVEAVPFRKLVHNNAL